MARALYRKYRSKSLSEIVGQKHITDVLERAIKSDRVAHAYLLTGPRGVGKTSVARILAHAINELPYTDDADHLDIIEIDAASNNGVDDVRDLREKARLAPSSAPKKIYIIDEVHMLSKPAFNALLKTLEEPPEHVVFILATTDVDKLPATIISRTQRFSFRAITTKDAVEHLKEIAAAEKIKIDDAALELIAERGDGSFRDSISLLDQLSSLSDDKQGITAELVESTLGLAPSKLIHDIIAAVENHDVSAVTKLLKGATDDGVSAVVLASQLTKQLQTEIVTKPQLLDLLDTLLDVARSSHPELKLLSVLGLAALPKTGSVKSAALEAPVHEISATIEELSEMALRDKPTPLPSPATRASQSSRVVTSEEETKSVVQPRAKHGRETVSSEDVTTKGDIEASAFDWDALIEYTRKEYVPLFSVLSKCKFEIDGSDLILYTNSAFYKKKLDDPKYSPMLYSSLEAIGSSSLVVHTLPTGAPIKDSQAASVAAIMGGGEEVSLDDTTA